jgi:hypothetical protein
MEFGAFERLVLRVLFETPDPLTTPHIAYLAGIPIERAERYLGRMVEQGTLVPQLGADEMIEYVFPGRRKMDSERRIASRGWNPLTAAGPSPQDRARMPLGEAAASEGHTGTTDDSDETEDGANAATAVLLSVLVPGAGHIYAGRSGAGVAWMATTLAGYACCLLPGLFLHGLCLVSAAHTREIG